MGQVSPQHYIQGLGEYTLLLPDAQGIAGPYLLHMQQLLFHLPVMTTGNVSGIAGAPGTSLREGNASIKIFSMTFLWIMHKKKDSRIK